MLGFCIMAPLGDAIAKLLGGRVGLAELLFIRFLIQAVVLVPLVAGSGRPWRMTGKTWRLAWLRTGLHMAGIGAMFTALRFMPLADAVAIAFVMPFIMLLLGRWFLGEEVGPRRLAACAVGFVGTLMVIQPSFAEVGLYALLPLAVAVIFAFFMLTTRFIARDTDPIGLQAVNGVMGVALLAPWILLVHGAGLADHASLVHLPADTHLLLLGIGLIGTSAHLLMTWSLRFAPSATLAPMQYLEIPMATVVGLLVFGDLPDGLAMVGITITMGAGLYVVMREQAEQRRSRRLSAAEASALMDEPAP